MEMNDLLSTPFLSSHSNIQVPVYCLPHRFKKKDWWTLFIQTLLPSPSPECFPSTLMLAHLWQRAHRLLRPFGKLEATFKFYSPISTAQSLWLTSMWGLHLKQEPSPRYDLRPTSPSRLQLHVTFHLNSFFVQVLPIPHLRHPPSNKPYWERLLNRSLLSCRVGF